MTSFTNRKIIDYSWWRTDRKPIPKSHVAILQVDAEERIKELSDDGVEEGDLSMTLWAGRNHKTRIDYQGYWRIDVSTREDGQCGQ